MVGTTRGLNGGAPRPNGRGRLCSSRMSRPLCALRACARDLPPARTLNLTRISPRAPPAPAMRAPPESVALTISQQPTPAFHQLCNCRPRCPCPFFAIKRPSRLACTKRSKSSQPSLAPVLPLSLNSSYPPADLQPSARGNVTRRAAAAAALRTVAQARQVSATELTRSTYPHVPPLL